MQQGYAIDSDVIHAMLCEEKLCGWRQLLPVLWDAGGVVRYWRMHLMCNANVLAAVPIRTSQFKACHQIDVKEESLMNLKEAIKEKPGGPSELYMTKPRKHWRQPALGQSSPTCHYQERGAANIMAQDGSDHQGPLQWGPEPIARV